jgi:hypothetical protein
MKKFNKMKKGKTGIVNGLNHFGATYSPISSMVKIKTKLEINKLLKTLDL